MVRLLALGVRGCRFESCLLYRSNRDSRWEYPNKRRHNPEKLRLLLLISVFGVMVAYLSPKVMIKIRIL